MIIRHKFVSFNDVKLATFNGKCLLKIYCCPYFHLYESVVLLIMHEDKFWITKRIYSKYFYAQNRETSVYEIRINHSMQNAKIFYIILNK